jgi:uncharacterized protein
MSPFRHNKGLSSGGFGNIVPPFKGKNGGFRLTFSFPNDYSRELVYNKANVMTFNNSYPLQPLPPLKPAKTVWRPGPTIGFTIVVLVAFIVVQSVVVIGPAIGSMMKGMDAGITSSDALLEYVMDDLNSQLGLLQSIATIVSGIIGTGLILVFIRARKGVGIKEYLGLKMISWKAALISIVVTAAYVGLALLVETCLGVQNDETIVNQIYDTSISPPLFWVAVILFAPLFEEALFRGFMWEGLRRSWWGVYGAVMLTAFAWALLHTVQYSLYGIIYIFLLGVLMGVVRWKTNSIWSTFIMHAVVNLIATISLAAGF